MRRVAKEHVGQHIRFEYDGVSKSVCYGLIEDVSVGQDGILLGERVEKCMKDLGSG